MTAHGSVARVIDVGARVARALETGRVPRTGATRVLARLWSAVSRTGVVRPLVLPAHARVVAVGGATLGGSGKTPLAIACALEYASRGERVALVGHAYLARPGRARIVAPDDRVEEVGDEALVCARALASTSARVVVAPTRQAALDLAATFADRIVLDGVAQTSPARAGLALLAVDAGEPWGAGDVPPLGDLRAPREAMLEACDSVVALADPLAASEPRQNGRVVQIASLGADARGEMVPWTALEALEVGLVTSLARSDRVLTFLARRGVTPRCTVRGRDHSAPRLPKAAAIPPVDLWLASTKCTTHLPCTLNGAPVATIDYGIIERALRWLP
jgi:tetraacyldisaccharide-1-P 4'-kinase